MGTPTIRWKLRTCLLVGVMLSAVVWTAWSLVMSTLHARAERAAMLAETARATRENTKQRAALKVPLATIGARPSTPSKPSTPNASAESTWIGTFNQRKPTNQADPVPLATVGTKSAVASAEENSGPEPIALATVKRSHANAQAVELLQPVTLLPPSQPPGPVELAGWPTTQPAGSPDIRLAKLDRLNRQIPPPLEEQRERDEARITSEQDTAKVVTGFECSTPLEIEKVSATHFRVSIKKPAARNWFMFRLEGVKGKTVRVDILNSPLNQWWSLNPVYSDVQSIDRLDAFAVTPVTPQKEPVKAYNGPLLPDTSGQLWQYISNVWMGEGTFSGTYSFVQHFEADRVYLAMRCPYTVAFNANYVESLKGHSSVKVINVGKSESGRPLTVIQVGESNPATVPCLVIYAREHGSENDTSWAVQGAIDFLLSNSPTAIKLRKNLTLLAIPMFDPDASAAAVYEGITEKFVHSAETSREAVDYANFFKKWVDAGNRLDVTIDLHNVESAEGEHIFCPVIEPAAKRSESSKAIHAQIMQSLADADYSVTTKPLRSHTAPFRLGGYLAQMYGPLFIPYELNSQQRVRHLTLAELQYMGRIFVESSTDFFVSDPGRLLAADVATVRQARDDRMARFGSVFQKRGINNALQIEWTLWRRELIEKSNGKRSKSERENGKVAHD